MEHMSESCSSDTQTFVVIQTRVLLFKPKRDMVNDSPFWKLVWKSAQTQKNYEIGPHIRF